MKRSNSKSHKYNRDETAFLYLRLSRDDNMDGESYSISNQKTLLTKIAKEEGYRNLVYYIDDGYTGVTMNRPDFQRMLRDLEEGKAAAVFVKDLSRLGRNYIEVGRLTEEFFPEYDIRLVAISDNVDSEKGDNEMTPIKNMFNEWYSRDISKKRRMQTAAMRIQQAQINFSELMNKVNQRLNGTRVGVTHSMPGNVPRFVYPPVDLSGSTKFQETCFKLWQSGVVSTKTMLQTHGYDIGQEQARRKQEEKEGVPGGDGNTTDPEQKGPGRPAMDDTERNSDKGNSLTGKQPKPSNPEGSL